MQQRFHYGAAESIALDLAPPQLIAHFRAVAGTSRDTPAKLVRRAVDKPIDFPPLRLAVIPSDQVVIAVEPGLPQGPAAVGTIVETLVAAGLAPRQITILRTLDDAEAGGPDPRSELPADIRSDVVLATHNPADRGQVAYLTNTLRGRPIYLSRAICDADLTISLGCLRTPAALNYFGIHTPIYPTFSDAETLRRFRNPELLARDPKMLARAQREVERVGWLTGTIFAVRVIAGVDGGLTAAFAGNVEAIARRGHQQAISTWTCTTSEPADLVVLGISGAANEQTWANVAIALRAGRALVAPGGGIVVCSDLRQPPGVAVGRLAGVEDRDLAMQTSLQDRPDDLLAAIQLAAALEVGRVYLFSHLEEDAVDELGITPITDPRDLSRLIARQSSCIVCEGAQYVRALGPDDLTEEST